MLMWYIYHFRALSKYRQAKGYIPKFHGLAKFKNEPSLVFNPGLVSARERLLGTTSQSGRPYFLNNVVKPFLLAVSEGVKFMHLRKLIGMELSLDTVLYEVCKTI